MKNNYFVKMRNINVPQCYNRNIFERESRKRRITFKANNLSGRLVIGRDLKCH